MKSITASQFLTKLAASGGPPMRPAASPEDWMPVAKGYTGDQTQTGIPYYTGPTLKPSAPPAGIARKSTPFTTPSVPTLPYYTGPTGAPKGDPTQGAAEFMDGKGPSAPPAPPPAITTYQGLVDAGLRSPSDDAGQYAPDVAPPAPAAPRASQFSAADLAAFRKATGTRFDPKSRMDALNMRNLLGGQQTLTARQYRNRPNQMVAKTASAFLTGLTR